jgi:hypothetical protein
MRAITCLFLVSALAACESQRPAASPVATTEPEPATNGTAMPIAASPEAAPAPSAEVAFDRPNKLTAGVIYRVEGTPLVIRNAGASTPNTTYGGGSSFYHVEVPLEVWLDGAHATLKVKNGVPTRWRGYQFVASEYEFSKGMTDAWVSVRRE